MSETSETAAVSPSQPNPLLKAWQTPFETPPFAGRSCPSTSCRPSSRPLPTIRRRSPRSPMTRRRRISPHHHRAGALGQACSPRSPRCSTTWCRRTRIPALLEIDKEVSLRMARHWNPIMMNAVLFGRIALLHDNRATLSLTLRAGAAAGPYLYPLPPRRRGARRSRKDTDGRGSTNAWPISARRSAIICSATSRNGSWSSARLISTASRKASSQPPRRRPRSGACPARP